MRILHTSDWHLGQNFYTKSRAPEHAAFLNWLTEMVEQHQVDAVIVAGDIFDTGSPPSYARELYYRFVVQLQATGCTLVVLGGNHDSVATLNESRELLGYLNTWVIASASDTEAPILLPLRNGEPGAVLCPVPFLRPRDIQVSQSGQSGQQKQQALVGAIHHYYQQGYEAACELRGNRKLPIIATGHLTTVGASKSDAVREIYIGTLDAFPASAFPPADYIALGHIHRPQKVTSSEHIRYCGSPIALSFDETNSTKMVLMVDFSEGELSAVTPLPVPVTQPLLMLKGSLESIKQQLEAWRDAPSTPVTWLDIELTTDQYLHDMQKQLQALTADLPVEIVLLRRSREQREKIIANQQKETLSELSTSEVFERRLAQENLDESQASRLRGLFAETLHRLEEEPES
ncbi:exonuclease subunit SbcD [Mangrovibacter plantisponsor]|uniref:Nuclease SbcCD subunit D n=1 Tax=Mangrovibacter plantisponsor TaxID=451513 RepID=A0A317PYX3_9ENTR|nr:exonuclease subunit SbcD [Mangrovibacter plantisponsor]PWW08276.1 exodeoxyribonuclease I subunit D [Mangrovibacter plantisponsor]